MTTLQKTITKGQLYVEGQNDSPLVTWNGSDYSCVASTTRKGFRESFGKKETVKQVSITIRLFNLSYSSGGEEIYSDMFTDEPTETNRVIFDGEEYEIYTIERPPHGGSITLKCESPWKGSAIR
jgi:phage-related protein